MKRFVIHIEGPRTAKMIHEMDSLYKGDYEIFPAIRNRKASTGISESFKKIISENYNEPEIHIIEDDINFTSIRSREYFEEQYKNLPEDWSIYLGGSYTHKVEEELNGLLKISDYRTFNSVVFRKSAYDILLAHNPEEHENIDYWASLNIKHAYLCWPMVAIEHPGHSYNAGRRVDYSSYLRNKKLLND